ncbi:Arm DNA-binding domain-containing protein [Azotobacter chroococcum]
MSKLTPKFVKETSAPGTYQDGRGLFLKVTAGGTKSWVFRYSFQGDRRDMGQGSFPAVSLRDARLEADKARLELARGTDPLARRHQLRHEAQAKRRKGTTFKTEAELFLRTHAPSWSPRHAVQWRNSLGTHVYPGSASCRWRRSTPIRCSMCWRRSGRRRRSPPPGCATASS